MHIIVLGAGIAGSAIAHELQKLQNIKVSIIDQNEGPAKNTSSHSSALIHPQVNRKSTKLQRLTQVANRIIWKKYSVALKHHQVFQPINPDDWFGEDHLSELLLRLGFCQSELVPVRKEQSISVTNVPENGLIFKTSGIYDLKQISEQSLNNLEDQQKIWGQKIVSIKKKNQTWQLFNDEGELVTQGEVVVLASNFDTKNLLQSIEINLPLRPVRGQLSRFILPKNSRLSERLPYISVRKNGYCTPAIAWDSNHWLWEIGSTYDEDIADLSPSILSTQANLERAKGFLNDASISIEDLTEHSYFVGIRSASKDRLPVIGPVPHHQGLLLACAYGSRGLIWATLGAALIKAYVEAFLTEADFLAAGFLTEALGEPVPSSLEEELSSSVSPMRFLG